MASIEKLKIEKVPMAKPSSPDKVEDPRFHREILDQEVGKKAAFERNISVEIEKEIIKKYAPLLMIGGKSKTEAQSEWIALYAEKYRLVFNSEKDLIIDMYKNDPSTAIEFIEGQLEANSD